MDSNRLEILLSDLDEDRRRGDEVGARLCTACVDILGVSGAGIALITDGQHRGSLGASNSAIRVVEELQFTLGEGPCIDAFHSLEAVHAPDLGDVASNRWPAFAPPAVDAGVRAVFGFPLRSGTTCLGALDLYLDEPGSLEPTQVGDAAVLADVITGTVLGLQADVAPRELADELEGVLRHRAIVHQASGMVSAQLDIHVRDALVRIRARAYIDSRPINDVAQDIVHRRLRMD